MPVTVAPRSEKDILLNRRSYGEILCRKSKTDLDSHHRSIQSDPGVRFDLNGSQNAYLKQHLKNLEVDFARGIIRHRHDRFRRRNLISAVNQEQNYGQTGFYPPMHRCYPTRPCLPNASNFYSTQPLKETKLSLDIESHQCHKQGRVISTSLSSSATSIYSEEDYNRYNRNPSPVPSFTSDCPSVPSVSARSSVYCVEEEEKPFESCSDLSIKKGNTNIDRISFVEKDQHGLEDFKNTASNNVNSSSRTQLNIPQISITLQETSLQNPPSDELDHKNNIKKSKETQDDNDDEEDLEYALSEFWRIEDGHRWSRMESKSSAIASPSERLSFPNYKNRQDGLNEDSNGDVFSTDEVPRLSSIDRSTNRRRSSQSQAHIEHKQTNLKPKSQSFLKRVGGDLKKFGSFKRKDSQRPVILPISLEDDPPKPVPRNRYKSLRKSRKVEIGDPVLQGGHDKFDQFKCAPIDSSGTGTKEPQRVRKPSSHSLISSSSSSGGASSVSTPASRRTRASIEDFSSDLNDLSPNLLHRGRNLLEMQHPHISSSSKSKESIPDKDGSTFVIPRNYKPGTFPSALREKNDDDVAQPPTTVSARSFSISDSLQSTPTPDLHRKSSRPMSIYDNLPNTGGNISAQDIINLLDPSVTTDDLNLHRDSVDSLEASGGGVDPAFWSVDDIVEHAQSLQQMVGAWDEDEVDETESKPKFDSIEAILNETVNYPMNPDHLPSYHADNISSIGDDSDSMSRISGEHRNQILLRWEPLRREDSSSTPTSDNLQLHNLSASQLMMLRRLSLLKLTARMEQYALSNNKGSLSWSMPRFIRRIREPDYRDKTVFGVPLLQNVQRIGQPLPICIQHALAYLRRSALDQIGLFRKPGVRGRIHKLRALCELSPEMETFEDCSDYDIADLIKQYFRELPDPLMTMKMSETFVGIFLHVPEDVRLQTLQAAIMLLPDENRETLKTLLNFLADVASRFDENQMNASNLSTCFAPSLFYQQLGNIRLTGSNTTKYKKAMPDMRAMNENKASNECLTFMINHVTELFKISEDAIAQCRMSVMQQSEDVLANEIGYKSDYQHEKDYYSDFHSYVDRAVRETFREEQRFNLNRSWQTVVSNSDCELAYRKLNDGNPLRLWRSKVEINDSDLVQIMDRILNERHLWDEELIQWKVLLQPDERTQLFQMIRSEMSPHPSRDYCVLRSWRSDVKSRGSSVIVEVSTGQPTMLGDVRGVVLMSRYVIEPTDVSGKFNLKHFCRVDTKGRNPEWYNKAYGHMVLQSLLKIKDSLKLFPSRSASFTS